MLHLLNFNQVTGSLKVPYLNKTDLPVLILQSLFSYFCFSVQLAMAIPSRFCWLLIKPAFVKYFNTVIMTFLFSYFQNKSQCLGWKTFQYFAKNINFRSKYRVEIGRSERLAFQSVGVQTIDWQQR